jgi:hypothetical protein
MFARPGARIGPCRTPAHSASSAVAIENRTAATVNGGTSSTASFPAGLVPPNQTAMPSRQR